MAELCLTGKIEDGKRLSIAPIASTEPARYPEPPDDTSGYFPIEERVSEPNGMVTILARISDAEAAYRSAVFSACPNLICASVQREQQSARPHLSRLSEYSLF